MNRMRIKHRSSRNLTIAYSAMNFDCFFSNQGMDCQRSFTFWRLENIQLTKDKWSWRWIVTPKVYAPVLCLGEYCVYVWEWKSWKSCLEKLINSSTLYRCDGNWLTYILHQQPAILFSKLGLGRISYSSLEVSRMGREWEEGQLLGFKAEKNKTLVTRLYYFVTVQTDDTITWCQIFTLALLKLAEKQGNLWDFQWDFLNVVF